MAESSEKTTGTPAVLLVPCADGDRAGCRIVRYAVELVAAVTPEVMVVAPEECERGTKAFIVAVDASSSCQASADLRENGIRPAVIVDTPTVLAKAGVLTPEVDPRAHIEEFAGLVANAIRDSLAAVLEQARERRRYREEMAPIITRFDGLWQKLTALPEPNGVPDQETAAKVELLGRRARNLFVKFDEVVPPSEWAEPHDLFQDALLCIAYATEGWTTGDHNRWEVHLEKAKVQLQPLLRRLT